MKTRKGGYKLVSLQLVELTTMTACDGLYDSIKNSHDKPLMITDIVINGERKNNAFAIAEKDGDAYVIKDVYGYDIKVDADNEVEVEEIDTRDVTLEVTNIKALTKAQCEKLKCGDKVLKKTGNQRHLYLVTYKEHHVGMCLSYVDASVVETQSYDYSGNTWVYNSEDKTPLIDVEGAESGTIVDALGLDAQGKLVKGTAGGGTKLYRHEVVSSNSSARKLYLINNISTPINIQKNQDGYYKIGDDTAIDYIFKKSFNALLLSTSAGDQYGVAVKVQGGGSAPLVITALSYGTDALSTITATMQDGDNTYTITDTVTEL